MMMWLYFFLLFVWQYCLVMGTCKTSTVNQDSGLKIAQVGDSITLHCSCADDKMTFFSWYQQKLGGKPELMSKWVKGTEHAIVEQVFQKRFSIFRTEHKKETNNLNITDVQTGDSASYFCVVEVSTAIEFGEGVFVHVQSSTSDKKSVIQEQAEKKLWRGEPLDLSCRVESESCSGKRRFFWLNHRPSQPAIIYPANEDCETSRKNCTVKLDIEAVEPTHEGTYYCVLSLCGELLFGNGTSVVIKDISRSLVNGLVSVLALFCLTNIMLIITICKLRENMSASHRHDAVGLKRRCASADMSDADIYYAALSINQKTEPQNQQDTMENTCTYSSVRSRRE